MMMEFEEDHEEEEEEEDEDEDKDHHHHHNHNNNNNNQEINFTPTTSSAAEKRVAPPVRYRECLKNHAVGIGGHAVDGCGEFMPAGVEGTLDALKCAACNCHRNFHRKELLALDATSPSLSLWTPPPPPPPHPRQQFPHHHHHPHFYPYNRTTPSPTGYLHVSQSSPRPPPLALPSPSSVPGRDASAGGGGGDGSGVMMMMTSSSGKKRHRTKFTQEQKDKMLELAERLGWRMQKEDEELVQQFCNESGVKRHVLKVWMHNNKHTLGFKRNRGRPKKSWGEVIRCDLSLLQLTEDMTLDRREWRARIRVAD